MRDTNWNLKEWGRIPMGSEARPFVVWLGEAVERCGLNSTETTVLVEMWLMGSTPRQFLENERRTTLAFMERGEGRPHMKRVNRAVASLREAGLV